MSRHRTSALRAFTELRCVPAVSGLARAEAHFRGLTFGDSHVEPVM